MLIECQVRDAKTEISVDCDVTRAFGTARLI